MSACLEMEMRAPLSRPFSLGTRRRRAPQARAASEAGASRSRGPRAYSLDTDKQLATSDRDWLQSTLTEGDLYRQQLALHRELLDTYHKIFQKFAQRRGEDPEQAAWWAAYQEESKQNPSETVTQQWVRVEKWLKTHKPTGANAQAVKWEKKWMRLQHCQQEWIGYRAECCGDRTKPIAVPIGCNDRLCPLCAGVRSRRARVKVKTMYDRITHPAMITLTIPNLSSIQKKHLNHFRKMIRQWLKQSKDWIEGGIYSIETTYNRKERTWHLHAHLLVSLSRPLPKKDDPMVDFYGKKVLPFTQLKWRLEFAWLNLSRDRWAKMPNVDQPKKGLTKWLRAWENYRAAFQVWTLERRDHETKWAKVWNPHKRRYDALRPDLTPAELKRFRELERWNAKNTRLIHIEPVRDRDGAVVEVLKYITKSAQFSDQPEAVEQFSAAVTGARLVQTFGSWYGFAIDTAFDPEHLDDWGERKCTCGLNIWQRIGVLFRRDVEMDESGRWFLRRPVAQTCRGTVPRPTIRALDAQPEREDDQLWPMELR